MLSINKYSEHYPVDIFVCLILTAILIPIALLNIDTAIRLVLGLPFILFIPGYLLIYVLFPKKNKEIDIIERVALSFGLSIAVVPLIGLGLNYTPWGITLPSVLAGNSIFIVGMGLLAIFRWKQTPAPQRIKYHINLRIIDTNAPKIDQVLTIILLMAISIALTTLVYVVATPKEGESFTEFYLLGPDGTLSDYPTSLLVGQDGKVIIGVANHEHQTKEYTVEVWLINQTTTINPETNETETVINHMWYMDQFTTGELPYLPVDIEKNWTAQWEQNYTFSVYRRGYHKLTFFLFNGTLDNKYTQRADYVELAQQKQHNAYQTLHLWLDVRTWQ